MQSVFVDAPTVFLQRPAWEAHLHQDMSNCSWGWVLSNSLSLIVWIFTALDFFFSGVKAWDIQRILSYPRECSCLSFAMYLRSLMMVEIDCFLHSTIVLFEVFVSIAAYLDSDGVNTKHQFYECNVFCEREEETWWIPVTEGVKNIRREAIDTEGMDRPCLCHLLYFLQSTISAQFVHSWVQWSKVCGSLLASRSTQGGTLLSTCTTRRKYVCSDWGTIFVASGAWSTMWCFLWFVQDCCDT